MIKVLALLVFAGIVLYLIFGKDTTGDQYLEEYKDEEREDD